MNLWIRSQDKETLIKCEKILVEEDKDRFAIVNYIDTKNWFRLGLYKTRERALEVLDEIQNFIEKQGTSDAISNEQGILESIEFYGKVYEMPKDLIFYHLEHNNTGNKFVGSKMNKALERK